MPASRYSSANSQSIIESLARAPSIQAVSPMAQRFIHSLRLIALHERAKRDPVPELAVRLGSVEVASKTLSLSLAIASAWPENIHVKRFCCELLSHDEATLGALIDCGAACDLEGFETAIAGLIRPDQTHRLWDGVLALVAAEARAN